MNPAVPSGRVPAGASDSHQSEQSNSHEFREKFRRFSGATAAVLGSPWAFCFAVVAIIIWVALGPVYHYSDTWQLVINTGTTIVTFLMVFVIQNTQNRDARAIHLKLDELLRGVKGARTKLVDLENCTEEELQHYENEFHQIRKRRADRDRARDIAQREPVASGK
jgi:low affinity Fe/Cu permease